MKKYDASAKERILTFVEQQLLAAGNTRFSIDEVTAGLGMSKKTFYQIFPTKESMLEELVRRITGFVGSRVDQIATGDGNFIEKLSALTAFFGTVHRRLALPLSPDFQRLHPNLWAVVEEFRTRKINSVFAHLFDQGKAEGYVAEGIDRDLFLLAYSTAIRSVIQPAVLMDQRLTVRDAVLQIVTLFFHGALTPAGRDLFAGMPRQQTHSS